MHWWLQAANIARNCFSKALSLASSLSLLTLLRCSHEHTMPKFQIMNDCHVCVAWTALVSPFCCRKVLRFQRYCGCASQLITGKYTCQNPLIGAFHTPTSNGFQHRFHAFWKMKKIQMGMTVKIVWNGALGLPSWLCGFGRCMSLRRHRKHPAPAGLDHSWGASYQHDLGQKIAWNGPYIFMEVSMNGGYTKVDDLQWKIQQKMIWAWGYPLLGNTLSLNFRKKCW